jgi:hypothetical protein
VSANAGPNRAATPRPADPAALDLPEPDLAVLADPRLEPGPLVLADLSDPVDRVDPVDPATVAGSTPLTTPMTQAASCCVW